MLPNGTQKNIIQGLLSTYIDDILELNQTDAKMALQAVLAVQISSEEKAFFIGKDVWEDISFIRTILSHDYPQNRSINYPYFGEPADTTMVVYKNAQGKAAFEKKGLLSLTVWDEPTVPPITKEAVVNYIQELINQALNKKNEMAESKESKSETAFFDTTRQVAIAAQHLRGMLKPEELTTIPLEILAQAPIGNRLGFCENVRDSRKPPIAERPLLDFSPENEFLSIVNAFLVRGMTPTQFMQFSKYAFGQIHLQSRSNLY